jgi:hypothetical protein
VRFIDLNDIFVGEELRKGIFSRSSAENNSCAAAFKRTRSRHNFITKGATWQLPSDLKREKLPEPTNKVESVTLDE